MEEVLKNLAAERKNLDCEIARQTFFCSRREELVSPAQCHDCFRTFPYTERLLRFNEKRSACISEHRIEAFSSSSEMQKENKRREKPETSRSSRQSHIEHFSVESYVLSGLLEFFMELDSLAERFGEWRNTHTRTAGECVHSSAELQELVLWFAERLAEFRSMLLGLGEKKKKQRKEK